ncbi:esterase/lipase family protein [Tumebacillus permanentifrigoris]|uniref:Alpha/beta hydrolase family protein n=1 Tax=Tumebacillus permanentifrigoris TaxID=378543 RepID=A0A316DDV3_9BACL|nr:alpha/beta hydrolase [Tumebacillus permanentifrigoris]PWK13837.1 alpha/beta hydrolase family protein [Tumebacillus permanentifrigoris]
MSLRLHRTQEKKGRALAVLLHGLGAPETWAEWEPLLAQDPQLADVDVALARYDTAHLVNGLFGGITGVLKLFKREVTLSREQVTDIATLALELKRELDSREYRHYDKIVLIGHSMGGLVGIHYLLQEIENNVPLRVGGYISLATPFNGAALAQYNKLLEWVNHNVQIQELRPNHKFLDDTIRLWMKHHAVPVMNSVQFRFCYGQTDEIVEATSAIPHVVASRWTGSTPLPGDHGGILSVADGQQSLAYIQVRDHILDVVDLLSPATAHRTDTTTPTNVVSFQDRTNVRANP